MAAGLCAQARLRIDPIQVFGDQANRPWNITRDGWVTCRNGQTGRASTWKLGTGFIDVPGAPVESYATGRNAGGAVAGYVSQSGYTQAFYYSPQTGYILVPYNKTSNTSTSFEAISDQGVCVSRDGATRNAWIWTAGGGGINIPWLPGTGDFYTQAYDINQSGVVCGVSGGGTGWVLILYTQGGGTVSIGGQFFIPEQINDRDEVTANNSGRGYVIVPGVGFRRLPVPEGTVDSRATGISSTRVVVGHVVDGNQGYRGVMWYPDLERFSILNDRLDDESRDYIVQQVYDINDSGLMVALAKRNGTDFLVQLTPLTTDTVPPDTFAVSTGRLVYGDVLSLKWVDDDALRVERFVVPNQSLPAISVQVSAKLPVGTIVGLAANVTARSSHGASAFQRLQFFDFSIGDYSTISQQIDPLPSSWSTFRLQVPSDPMRYMSQSRVVRMRYEIRTVGPSSSSTWSADHDFVQFEYRAEL